MGLGGELLWTPILREIHRRRGKPVKLYARPKLSDLLVGTKYDRAMTRLSSPVFNNNPHVSSNECIFKNHFSKKIDAWFESILELCHLRKVYDNFWYYYSKKHGFEFIYLDLPHHSYAACEFEGRFIWKAPGHSIDIIARSVGINESVPYECKLFFEKEDLKKVDSLIVRHELDRFVVIEPCTNTEYFGNLRAWPFKRWQKVIDRLFLKYPQFKVVQVGLKDNQHLDGCLNFCGHLTFRETAALIERSVLFLGTDGGLMHVANAVDANAVIVWGGVNDPEFLGYPEKQSVICLHVACSPCGLRGNCLNGHICMLNIQVDDVFTVVENELQTISVSSKRLDESNPAENC